MFMQANSKCAHQVRPPPGRFGWCSAVGKRFATTLHMTHRLLGVAIYARNSAAWSVAHSRKVRGGAPVSSANVDVTNAG